MKVVVDSNIIISGLINFAGKEFSLLANRNNVLEFFSSQLIITETSKRFKQISSLTKNDEGEIDKATLDKAALLVEGLDRNDYLFLAVNPSL